MEKASKQWIPFEKLEYDGAFIDVQKLQGIEKYTISIDVRYKQGRSHYANSNYEFQSLEKALRSAKKWIDKNRNRFGW